MVWLTWVGLPALALLIGVREGWPAGLFVLAVGVAAQPVYRRWFPRLSPMLGYGSVEDVPAPKGLRPGAGRVILYTANVCPFCPIVRERLKTLRRDLAFELEERDVTFHPQLVRDKGFRSVPVIEADGRYLTGNATSQQLAEFLTAR